jgi:hypothetical protein
MICDLGALSDSYASKYAFGFNRGRSHANLGGHIGKPMGAERPPGVGTPDDKIYDIVTRGTTSRPI